MDRRAASARRLVIATALALAALAVGAAVRLADSVRGWNGELALPRPPLAATPPALDDPGTPRLARRVVVVIVDGLRLEASRLPFLDALRRRGVDTTAAVPYPTISRPNYVTILTGVPPRDSGVRTNRVRAPVTVDSLMARARAAGLRVASASDMGTLASLFVHGGDDTFAINSISYPTDGAGVVRPPAAPLGWPFDEVRKLPSVGALGAALRALLAGDAALVLVLAGDADRAGHAEGAASERYRRAAASIDHALGEALAGLDLSRDAVLVTADHGHIDRGGHGGPEPEVATVPVILAGAGVVPGAGVRGAALVDLAPTVAALLGLPAPGHGAGTTLTAALELDPAAAARRLAADDARRRALAPALAPAAGGVDPARLALAAAALLAAALLARALARRGALAVPRPRWRALPVTVIAPAVVVLAMIAVTGARFSPSYVPSLGRLQKILAIVATAGIAAQVLACVRALRRSRAPDGATALAAASGLAAVGLAAALVPVALVRAWFSPPHLDVPPPFWFVAIPALELAAACACAAAALLLVAELARECAPSTSVARSRTRAARDVKEPHPGETQ